MQRLIDELYREELREARSRVVLLLLFVTIRVPVKRQRGEHPISRSNRSAYDSTMTTQTLLIIVVLVLLLGGGGFFNTRPGR